MAKYTGVTQNKDGSWSYRIKKKVDGKVIDTKIKKDDSGMPFLTARACYEAKIRHEAQITNGEVKIAHRPSKTTLIAVFVLLGVGLETHCFVPPLDVLFPENMVSPDGGERSAAVPCFSLYVNQSSGCSFSQIHTYLFWG